MRAAVLVPLMIACADEPAQVAPVEGPALVSIAVEPPEQTVETSPGGGSQVQFFAMGTYEDGTEAPLTTLDWVVSNPTAGSVDEDGIFTPVSTNGGVSWVTARYAGVEGSATVTVRYTDEVLDPAVDPALFDAPVTPVSGTWTYPADGVNFPRNTPSIHFQWNDLGAQGYRLRFASELTELTTYTASTSLLLDVVTWSTIASTNAGGSVEVTLEAAVGGQVLQEAPITLQVNRMDAEGSVIYWSTSAAGFLEIPYGGVAVDYLTQAMTGRCVGCHAISSDGKIAYTWDGGDGILGVQTLDGAAILGDAQGQRSNFKTFSPDGRFLMATLGGNLTLYDANTGAWLSTVRALGDATHVDWAPDDSAVAFTLTGGHTTDFLVYTSARIAVMPHLGNGVFGDPIVLHEAPEPWRAYYPAWSPDSEWIAFNRSTGDTYDDPDAEVWVVDRDGSRPAVRLDAANQVGQLYNSWPRWGPLPDDEVLWLTFASRRNYGTQSVGLPQIWVAAFDPAKATDGVDPSWPAFWLPGQPVTTGNHTPVWVE